MENIKKFKCECGGLIIKLPDGYECSQCKMKIYNKFMDKDLSFEQIIDLFHGNKVEFENIRSKDGHYINATLYSNEMELYL